MLGKETKLCFFKEEVKLPDRVLCVSLESKGVDDIESLVLKAKRQLQWPGT
uniref:Uncharacterized protein n=1 Tax=Rhizophora mucronata TaxID=61149 RepID=A0A2P2MNV2_RHIMU